MVNDEDQSMEQEVPSEAFSDSVISLLESNPEIFAQSEALISSYDQANERYSDYSTAIRRVDNINAQIANLNENLSPEDAKGAVDSLERSRRKPQATISAYEARRKASIVTNVRHILHNPNVTQAVRSLEDAVLEGLTSGTVETSEKPVAPEAELPEANLSQKRADRLMRFGIIYSLIMNSGETGTTVNEMHPVVEDYLGYTLSVKTIRKTADELDESVVRVEGERKNGSHQTYFPLILEEPEELSVPQIELPLATLAQKKADRAIRHDYVEQIVTDLNGGNVFEIHPDVEKRLGYRISVKTIREDANELVETGRLRIEEEMRQGATRTYLPSLEETVEDEVAEQPTTEMDLVPFKDNHARRAVLEYVIAENNPTSSDIDTMLEERFTGIPDNARFNLLNYWNKRGIIKASRRGRNAPYEHSEGKLRSYRTQGFGETLPEILIAAGEAGIAPSEIREKLDEVVDFTYNERSVAHALTKLPVRHKSGGGGGKYFWNAAIAELAQEVSKPNGDKPNGGVVRPTYELEHAINAYGDAAGVQNLATLPISEGDNPSNIMSELYDFARGVRIARSWTNGNRAVFREGMDEGYDESKGRCLNSEEAIAFYEAIVLGLDGLRSPAHTNRLNRIMDTETLPLYVHNMAVHEALTNALTRVHSEDSRLVQSLHLNPL
tara:strand:- start:91 stop:2094 length:2004 start_codon:yes stop_codon:yes gene_type:complete